MSERNSSVDKKNKSRPKANRLAFVPSLQKRTYTKPKAASDQLTLL